MPASDSKEQIRKELLRKRDRIPPEVRKVKSAMIRSACLDLDEIRDSHVICIFASFRSEVDTFEMMNDLFASRKRVVLPKVDAEEGKLSLYEIHSIDELSRGYMGISEPDVNNEERSVSIEEVDAVIVPGVGFDASGNRLGYGAGYYDILLSDISRSLPVIAPAFEEQVVDSIPSESHDIKVHAVITERRIIKCSQT